MTRMLLLLVALLPAAPLTAQEPPRSGNEPASKPLADARELQELNRLWFEAYRTKDAAKLGRILAEDFVGIYGGGPPRTRQDMLKSLADPNRPALDIHSDEVVVSLFGDTAMVTGRSTTRTMSDGQPVLTSNRYADIYMRRNAAWQAVAAHVVRVPPPR